MNVEDCLFFHFFALIGGRADSNGGKFRRAGGRLEEVITDAD